jgi:ABC-type antimicrobial peptide transport system permease subunit
LRREVHPTVYVPVTGGGATFELRTASSPAALVPTVRKTVSDTDSNLPIFGISTQSKRIDELLTQERLIARLGSAFGGLALLLACVGLYGLLSYEVSRRTREIAAGAAVTRFLSSLLFGLKASDPVTFAGVSLILMAVALLACYLPARRATKVDPMVALRYE